MIVKNIKDNILLLHGYIALRDTYAKCYIQRYIMCYIVD